MAQFCANIELCKITEDLVFTDPYRIARWQSLDQSPAGRVAASFRADAALKAEVQG